MNHFLKSVAKFDPYTNMLTLLDLRDLVDLAKEL